MVHVIIFISLKDTLPTFFLCYFPNLAYAGSLKTKLTPILGTEKIISKRCEYATHGRGDGRPGSLRQAHTS